MSTTLAVLLVGCAGFALRVALAAVRGRGQGLVDPADPADAADADHWIVARVAALPRLRRFLAHLDRRVVGGAREWITAVAKRFGEPADETPRPTPRLSAAEREQDGREREMNGARHG